MKMDMRIKNGYRIIEFIIWIQKVLSTQSQPKNNRSIPNDAKEEVEKDKEPYIWRGAQRNKRR